MNYLQASFKHFLCLLFIILISASAIAQNSLQDGINLFEEGDLAEAKSFFEDYLDSNKRDPEANFYLGRIYFNESEYGKAVDWFEKAAKYDKRNSIYHMWLGHSYGRRAQTAGKLKQAFLAKDSRKNYEKAIEFDPSNVEARESAMEFYLQAPGFMGGGRDKAENQASTILELDEVAGYVAWGRIYSHYDEDDAALENYTTANELFPEEMIFYYRLYSYHIGLDQFEEAINIVEKQLAINDTTANIYMNLGNAHQYNETYEESFAAYEKALIADEEYFSTWYQIGRLAALSGMYLDEGEENLIRFIGKKDEYNETSLSWAYYRLGTIYEHKESIDAAKDQYKQALKANKDHEEAKEALSRLD